MLLKPCYAVGEHIHQAVSAQMQFRPDSDRLRKSEQYGGEGNYKSESEEREKGIEQMAADGKQHLAGVWQAVFQYAWVGFHLAGQRTGMWTSFFSRKNSSENQQESGYS